MVGVNDMLNYEWKTAFKKKYLEVQHALAEKWKDEETTMENNKKAVNELKELCEKYLREN